VSAVLTCLRYRASRHPEFTEWTSAEEAAEACRVLAYPTCGPRCEGVYTVSWCDEDGTVHSVTTPLAQPPTLADQLDELYPRLPIDPKHCAVALGEYCEALTGFRPPPLISEKSNRSARLALLRALAAPHAHAKSAPKRHRRTITA
jgi:hypothetical protein